MSSKKLSVITGLATAIGTTGCTNLELWTGVVHSAEQNNAMATVVAKDNSSAVKTILDENNQTIIVAGIVAGKAGENIILTAGGSTAKENNLKGHSVFGGATITQPTKGINYVSVGAEHQYVGSTDLWNNITVNTTEQTEIANNQKTTTTTTTTTTTNNKLQGGRSTTVRAEAGIKTTENGTAIVGVAHTTGHNPHNKDTALKAGYEHNFNNARVSATIDTNGYANGTLRTNLTDNLSAFVGAGKNIKHGNDEKIFAGLSYSFGGGHNNNNNYTTQSRMDHIVGDFGLHSPQVASNLTNKTTYTTNTTINKIINKKTETIPTPPTTKPTTEPTKPTTEPTKPTTEPTKPTTEPELITKKGDSTTHKIDEYNPEKHGNITTSTPLDENGNPVLPPTHTVPELEFNIEELVEQEFVKNFPGYPNIIEWTVDFDRRLGYNYHISNDFEVVEWQNWGGLRYENIDNYFDPKVWKRFIRFTNPTDNRDNLHEFKVKHKKTGIIKTIRTNFLFSDNILD